MARRRYRRTVRYGAGQYKDDADMHASAYDNEDPKRRQKGLV